MEEERRDTSSERQEEDPRAFENISREEREGLSPSIGEEGTEEDRKHSGRGPATYTKKPSRLLRMKKSLTEREKRGGMITLKADDASGASTHEGFVLRGH